MIVAFVWGIRKCAVGFWTLYEVSIGLRKPSVGVVVAVELVTDTFEDSPLDVR